jgi:hypothetical protein
MSARKSDDGNDDFSDFESLDKLFSKADIKNIVDFFDLSDDYNDYRRQDFGSCTLVMDRTDLQCIYRLPPIYLPLLNHF